MREIADIEKMLGEYREIETRIETLKMELDSIDRYNISALDYSGDRVQTTGISKPAERTAIERVEKEEEIEIAKAKLAILEKAMCALPDTEREIVQMSVIEKQPYHRLCGKLHIGGRHIRRKKREAIRTLRNILA